MNFAAKWFRRSADFILWARHRRGGAGLRGNKIYTLRRQERSPILVAMVVQQICLEKVGILEKISQSQYEAATALSAIKRYQSTKERNAGKKYKLVSKLSLDILTRATIMKKNA